MDEVFAPDEVIFSGLTLGLRGAFFCLPVKLAATSPALTSSLGAFEIPFGFGYFPLTILAVRSLRAVAMACTLTLVDMACGS